MKSICIEIKGFGTKIWRNKLNKVHREDGPAAEYSDGKVFWYVEDKKLDPNIAVNDPELQARYPKLIESMIVYLVHES